VAGGARRTCGLAANFRVYGHIRRRRAHGRQLWRLPLGGLARRRQELARGRAVGLDAGHLGRGTLLLVHLVLGACGARARCLRRLREKHPQGLCAGTAMGRAAEEAAEGVAALRGVCSGVRRVRRAVRQRVLGAADSLLEAGRRVRGAGRRDLVHLVLGACGAIAHSYRRCEVLCGTSLRTLAVGAAVDAPPNRPLKGLLLAALAAAFTGAASWTASLT